MLPLLGGDTTFSETLTVSVTLMGEVALGQAIKRSGAQEGDEIWVSGSIGDAGLALVQLLAKQQPDCVIEPRLHRPTPRVGLGVALLDIATSAIDISDGFLADLGHLLKASRVGAALRIDCMPFSDPVEAWIGQAGWEKPLTSGDDYELIFTASSQYHAQIQSLASAVGVQVSCVGSIISKQQGLVITKDGKEQLIPTRKGFDHFA